MRRGRSVLLACWHWHGRCRGPPVRGGAEASFKHRGRAASTGSSWCRLEAGLNLGPQSRRLCQHCRCGDAISRVACSKRRARIIEGLQHDDAAPVVGGVDTALGGWQPQLLGHGVWQWLLHQAILFSL